MNLQIDPRSTAQSLDSQDASRRSLLKAVIGITLLIALLGAFYAYTHRGNTSTRGRLGQVAPVKVALVEQRDMSVIERTIGTVVANASVSITARVQGQLVSANFKEGQTVKKGDLLFVIDPAPYKAAYDSALGVLMGAKTNADRSANLLKQNAVAAQSNDNAQAVYQQAKANAEAARLNLQFTQIRSPIDGKTGPILLQSGNLVSVNGITAPLVTITQIQPIKVSFALPQSDLPRIQARFHNGGLEARVLLHDQGGEDLVAPIDFVSNAVSASSGTIELRATFPNTDSALVPGQLVDVVVELSSIKNAIVVPREAINTSSDGNYVYVARDNVAVQEMVKVQFDDGTNVAIQGHVRHGDKVIVDGALRVVPGSKLSIAHPKGAGKAGAGNGEAMHRGGQH